MKVTSDASFGDVAAGAFYGAAGDGFDPSELTRGPWDRASQHAGPPAALLGREVEQCGGIGDGPADRHVGRITFEVLAPVPIAPLRVRASVERGGRRVDMVEAVLTDAAGVPLMRARAWRLLRREVDLPEGLDSLAPASPARRAGRPGGATGQPPPPGDIPRSSSYFPTDDVVGYHSAMEYRFARSAFTEDGPATTWLRALHPLVEGEVITPLQRVLLAADSGNGISSTWISAATCSSTSISASTSRGCRPASGSASIRSPSPSRPGWA